MVFVVLIFFIYILYFIFYLHFIWISSPLIICVAKSFFHILVSSRAYFAFNALTLPHTIPEVNSVVHY